ncbi:radical SAM/SPASM domain-containing protein [Streptosporangium saharense]|uniref:MoaA/NifB/PqqE/SkfB family radical SAM enzyme n=1 Tax=Streptosporangium saharense TaxID=1706840 RepID=A0A7W7VL43_9ACTN|nr:radical SAM protein [Streptosporangium saharense]MBB4914024.1 MoaA/NifB/PqqE/SkfB family radical SAM enzyme [Streptosporangium saharense]
MTEYEQRLISLLVGTHLGWRYEARALPRLPRSNISIIASSGEDVKRSTLKFAWWEITGRCQLACDHCYASSGPNGSQGTMTDADWRRVITQTRESGAEMGQFIGGEPTLHPSLSDLVAHALDTGMEVEIYTNLVHVTPAMWETFQLPGVRLATSYYSDHPEEHRLITKRPSLRATTRNSARLRELGIPLRVGVVEVLERQRSRQAVDILKQLGISEVGYDNLREVGRGVRENGPDVEQLCGRCGQGQIAVSPTGEVWPCAFSRWMPLGNVRQDSLMDIAR